MALSWWEKGLWQICMHHWTVHAKVEFEKFPPDVRIRGVHSATFDLELKWIWIFFQSWGVHSTTIGPELRNELKNFSNPWGSIPQLWSWTQIWKFCIDIFMGFPSILSTLQPFQICIFNRKNSKLSFSNGSQLMGKRFMANFACTIRQYMQK